MQEGEPSATYEVGIVSCDIVGHSSVSDPGLQRARIAAINRIVAATIDADPSPDAIWASGGDGGHLLMRRRPWCAAALDLIERLHRWSVTDDVPLRIVAHVGQVTDMIGADGRVQAVGDGINVAGWLLTRGSAAGVIVSDAFQAAVEAARPEPAVDFHDARTLLDKRGDAHRLSLMSTPTIRSGWDMPTEEDRSMLAEAVAQGNGWDVLYRAKRILQINQNDAQAIGALRKLRQRDLTYAREDVRGEGNPFLEYLGPPALSEVIRAGELVERRYNEYICRLHDRGNTMFVILRGQVGVYLPQRGDQPVIRPAFVHQEGEIVGELAFALSRSRTADLVALTDVTLLALTYDDISARVGPKPLERLRNFMTARVVEHASGKVAFLRPPPPDPDGPAPDPRWADVVETLQDHSELVTVKSPHLRLELSDVRSADPDLGPGVYLLAGGEICSQAASDRRGPQAPAKKLDGETFPLLWIDLPEVIVLPRRQFRVLSEPVKVLHLGARAFTALDVPQREALYRALRSAAADCFDFDAFISYNSVDLEVAQKLTAALQEAGMHVFMDVPKRGGEFPPRLWSAIRHSRALVPLISPNVMVRVEDENWVIREIQAHRHYFDERRIYPMNLPGGRPDLIAPGFRPIEMGRGDDDRALAELIQELTLLRDGVDEPPFSYAAKTDPDSR